MSAKKRAPKEKKKADPRVLAILSAIDVRRQELKIATLNELTRRAQRLDDPPDNASTWLGWRNGSRSPKLVDLDDFASVVGLSVGLVQYASRQTGDGTPAIQGALDMSSHAASVAALMKDLTPEDQERIHSYVSNLHAIRGVNSNPHEPGDVAGTSDPAK